MSFEILEHKADLKIRVVGETKERLFENAMLGMFEGAKYEPMANSQLLMAKIKISSIDLPSLLVDFLSELLYLAETKKEVYQKIDFKKLTDNEIKATLIGKPLKRMGVHIKGVTFHDLDVHQKEDGIWQAIILFDI